MTRNQKIYLGIALIIGIFLLRFLGIRDYFDLEFIKNSADQIQVFVKNNYLVAAILYIAFFTVVVAFTIPISILLTVAGGYFFHVIPAVIYSNIGAVGGSTITFLVFRYLFREAARKKYGDRFPQVRENLRRNGAYYLLFMQLLPITPFTVITILAGISDISVFTFMWATSLGILPGSIIYVLAGKQLAALTSVKSIMTPRVIIILTLLALFALAPIIYRYIRSRKK